jgi:hypothetical protein
MKDFNKGNRTPMGGVHKPYGITLKLKEIQYDSMLRRGIVNDY